MRLAGQLIPDWHVDNVLEGLFTDVDAHAYGTFATPPAYFDGCYHIFGIRREHTGTYFVYWLGCNRADAVSSHTCYVPGKRWVTTALAHAKQQWPEMLLPRMPAATHTLLKHGRLTTMQLFGNLHGTSAEIVPPSVLGTLGVVGCAIDAAEQVELLLDGKRPAICYCGDCGITFTNRCCALCGTESALAWDAAEVCALPPQAWRRAVAAGHKFVIDQREAYLFEYSRWAEAVRKSLPQIADKNPTRNQRTVLLGES